MSEIILAQNIHFGILCNYFPEMVDNSNVYEKHEVNLIGLDLRIKNQFLENLSTGIILQYGNKNLLDDSPKTSEGLPIFDAMRDIHLFSLEAPLMYKFLFLDNFSFYLGLKFGVGRLTIDDIIIWYTGSGVEVHFSDSSYELSYSPSFEINYIFKNKYEILFGVEYKILDFSIKHDYKKINIIHTPYPGLNLNKTPHPGPNVITGESQNYYYNVKFTGISISVGVKYIL